MPADESRNLVVYKVRPILVNRFLPYSSIQPSIPIPTRPTNTLKARVLLASSSWEEVDTFDTLADAYPLGLPRDIIHFVVDRPGMQFCSFLIFGPLNRPLAPAPSATDEPEGISMPSLSMVDLRARYFTENATKALSARGQLLAVIATQRKDRSALLCGRPLHREAAVPASLLDERLAKFCNNLDHLAPTPADVECFYLLRESLTSFFDNEALRCNALTNVLSKSILPANAVLQRGAVSRYSTDGDLRVDTAAGSFIYFLQEVKNEVGQGGAIPQFEAIHYWIEQIRIILESEKLSQSESVSMNFPIILLQHFGQSLGSPIRSYT